LCSPEVRSPLTELEDSTKERIRAAMVQAGLLN
ncbi:MAG: 4-hydroxy-tetrahydrodipicolinate synthase, partial [Rhodobacteraceae bacterium]|nr:4-hydroxy-tetrahydrodipicolinate synthase [Paracoccaceae bacterium]